MNLTVSIISDHYGVPLTRMVLAPPDSSTIAIEMLIAGIVDVVGPDFSLGGEFMGIARKRVTQQSCATLDGLGLFTVLDNSPFTSFADLQAAPTLTTFTNAAGAATVYSSVLPNLVITAVNPAISDADIVAALRAGTIDVAINLDVGFLASEGIDVTGLRDFFGGFDDPNGWLFAIRCLPKRCCGKKNQKW
jgi:ABC-type nitrate/sulfonate/bicarbonate transport system substrate-binding protein